MNYTYPDIDEKLVDDTIDTVVKRIPRKSTSKPTILRVEPSADSSRAINANLSSFFDNNLGIEISEYGKAAIMSLANDNKLPRFSKYSGVAEWNNCVFLWVNIFINKNLNQCNNNFTENGKYIDWYGGSKMSAGKFHSFIQNSSFKFNYAFYFIESEITKRLLNENETIILFIRIENRNYSCLGRLKHISSDINMFPISFKWELLDYLNIKTKQYFQEILKISK